MKRVGSVMPGQVWDAGTRANAIMSVARKEAERLIAEARAQADAVRTEARLEGLAQGRADAETAFTGLLLTARADAERVRATAVPSARSLAVKMAEKIVRQAVHLEPAVLAEIVKNALTAARSRSGVVLLRVHPDDLASITEARPALLAVLASTVDLRLVADESVGRAGCVVETPVGRLDARLTTQLRALEQAVYGEGASAGQGGNARDAASAVEGASDADGPRTRSGASRG